jgi:hypothetical protein
MKRYPPLDSFTDLLGNPVTQPIHLLLSLLGAVPHLIPDELSNKEIDHQG